MTLEQRSPIIHASMVCATHSSLTRIAAVLGTKLLPLPEGRQLSRSRRRCARRPDAGWLLLLRHHSAAVCWLSCAGTPQKWLAVRGWQCVAGQEIERRERLPQLNRCSRNVQALLAAKTGRRPPICGA